MPDRLKLDEVPIGDLPLYNSDLDDNPPQPWVAFRDRIRRADAVLFVTPEYNRSVPGVLKNAIDWASRPGFASPLKGKPALIITTSPGMFGGVRAQAQIRDALAATLARPVARQHLAIPAVDKKLADGRLADEPTRALLRAGLDDLLTEVALLAAGRRLSTAA
jgi:chromate reductase